MQNPADCPSCERFIGPADVCPYCGCDSARNPVLRHMRHASLALAILGLAFLWFAVRQQEIPLVRMADITPGMNYAYIRIPGTVEKDATVDQKNNGAAYVGFWLKDGTNRIRVRAYRDVAADMIQKKLTPQAGSRLIVSGGLGLSGENGPVLFMKTADGITPQP